MRIGPFWFDSKEMFLVLTALLIGVASYFNWPIPFFDKQALLILAILFLFIKGLLPSVHNENFLILAIVTIFLSLYLAVFQVILFFLISLILFRILKVI